MELPDVGHHCSFPTCNQLDFLPLTCNNCRLNFCKDHFTTSAHECKCLNEFFKKPVKIDPSTLYLCNMKDCKERGMIHLPCPHCNIHYCVGHRHHGCQDDMLNKELRKQKVEEWKKPKEQFRIAKIEADRKVEQALRKAELEGDNKLSPMARKVRLMKLKNKALGENKIPPADRLYFAVHGPIEEHLLPQPLFTSRCFTVGRTIDLFAKRMKIENKNNVPGAKKLILFHADGHMLELDKTMDRLLEDGVIQNGDGLVLNTISEEAWNQSELRLDEDLVRQYKLATV